MAGQFGLRTFIKILLAEKKYYVKILVTIKNC